MGQKQELKDRKPESSVEHEIESSSTSEAGQLLPADSHDRKQLETDPPDSQKRFKAGSTPKALVKKHHILLFLNAIKHEVYHLCVDYIDGQKLVHKCLLVITIMHCTERNIYTKQISE
jgi:hypothetical protein